MTLWLFDLKPSKKLKKQLDESGATVTLGAGSGSPKWMVFRATTKKDLVRLLEQRAQHPTAHTAAVIQDDALEKEDFRHSLLEAGVDDIWTLNTWELVLPSHLRRQEMFDELNDRTQQLLESLERDVDLAQQVQSSLIPSNAPEIPNIEIATRFLPSSGVGGDYFDIFELDDKNKFGFLVVASETHGLAAALLGVLVKIRSEEMRARFPDTLSFVAHLREELLKSYAPQLGNLDLFYGILDRATLTLRFTTAGTVLPWLWREGKFVDLELSIGPSMIASADLHEQQVQLQPSDRLLLATHGWDRLMEQLNLEFQKVLKDLYGRKPVLSLRSVQNELVALADRRKATSPLENDLTLVQLEVPKRILFRAT